MTWYYTAWNRSDTSSSKGPTRQKESQNLHTHHILNFFQFPSLNKTRGCFLSPACISIIQYREQFSVWKETTLGFQINIKTNPHTLVVSPKKQSSELGKERRWVQQMQALPWILLAEKQNNNKALRYYLLSTWKNIQGAQSKFSSQHFLPICSDTRPSQQDYKWHCQSSWPGSTGTPERVQL